jgi:hypothetical protein
MKMTVTITDLTRMQDDRVCVAGCLSDLTCIRPVLKRDALHQWWLCAADGTVLVRPFALVEFDVGAKVPDPPHTEDRVIDPLYRLPKGQLAAEQRRDLLTQLDDGSVVAIFSATLHHDQGWYVMAGEGTRSLGTIRPAHLEAVSYAPREASRWDYRLSFADATGQEYRLAVTDLAFRYCLDHLRERRGMSPRAAAECVTRVLQQRQVFLRIGLARGWEKHPERCHLQITGVYRKHARGHRPSGRR